MYVIYMLRPLENKIQCIGKNWVYILKEKYNILKITQYIEKKSSELINIQYIKKIYNTFTSN